MTHELIFLIFLFLAFIDCQARLAFSAAGEFVILQYTDLHLCEDPVLDAKTFELQEDLIQRVKPDLVVITGDIISSELYTGHSDFFVECWTKFIEFFNQHRIYYAFALGADDFKAGFDRKKIAELENSSQFSVYKENFGSGYDFAYYIPIFSSSNRKKMAANLWMFNSYSIGCLKESNSWGCVDPKEIAWYNKYSGAIRQVYGDNVHHIAFMHRPLPEFLHLYNNNEYYGNRNEGVSCPLLNTGLFNAFKMNNDVSGVFVGHDHLNDYGGWVEDIELVYGRKTGYGGYGNRIDYQKGARVIKLKEILSDNPNENKVQRDHFVIVEDPEKEGKQEELKEKMFKVRFETKQEVCRAAITQSVLMSSTWIGVTLIVIFGVGIAANRFLTKKFISPFKKKDKSSVNALRMQKIQSAPNSSV